MNSADPSKTMNPSETTDPSGTIDHGRSVASRPRFASRHLVGFLLGHRRSIVRALGCRSALGLGLVLVLTAALAREYDTVSLLHRPGDLLGPFAASLILATVLYVWYGSAAWTMSIKVRSPGRFYLAFLSAYWLTAPLAWLYAVPVETFADEVTAIRCNLTFLSVVSIWRVVLFAKIASVLYRIRFLVSLVVLLIPCAAVAFVGIAMTVLRIVGLMGGVRLTLSEQILVNYEEFVAGVIFYGFIPTVLVAAFAVTMNRRRHAANRWMQQPVGLTTGVWMVPSLAAAVLLIGLIRFQPPLYRAEVVDRQLRVGDVAGAIESMGRWDTSSVPVHWDPPPSEVRSPSSQPTTEELLVGLEAASPPPWVVRRLLDRVDEQILWRVHPFRRAESLSLENDRLLHAEIAELERMGELYRRMMALPIAADQRDRIERLLPIIEASLDRALCEQASF